MKASLTSIELKRELCEEGGERNELWVQRRSFPPLQQQAHPINIT